MEPLKSRSTLSSEEFLFAHSRIPEGYPIGRIDSNVVVVIGARALGKLGRELARLSENATCRPSAKNGKFFFDFMDGWNIGKIPLSNLEDAIMNRVRSRAASFRAKLSGVEWREVQFSPQMVVQLTPLVEN